MVNLCLEEEMIYTSIYTGAVSRLESVGWSQLVSGNQKMIASRDLSVREGSLLAVTIYAVIKDSSNGKLMCLLHATGDQSRAKEKILECCPHSPWPNPVLSNFACLFFFFVIPLSPVIYKCRMQQCGIRNYGAAKYAGKITKYAQCKRKMQREQARRLRHQFNSIIKSKH